MKVSRLVGDDLQQPGPEPAPSRKPPSAPYALTKASCTTSSASDPPRAASRSATPRGMTTHQLRVRVAISGAHPGQYFGIVAVKR